MPSSGCHDFGNRDRRAVVDLDHPQHGDFRQPAHPVIGALATVDQSLLGHVGEQFLEGNLVLPLEAELARNLALAGGAVGRSDEFEDLILRGEAVVLAGHSPVYGERLSRFQAA